mmetsp:Transcript_2121/g.4241  ORF Transcript_2121/g.4241 Transcript_2121/m.4241 type:complete len:221 (-) Transcript_2121:1276-1938(-)
MDFLLDFRFVPLLMSASWDVELNLVFLVSDMEFLLLVRKLADEDFGLLHDVLDQESLLERLLIFPPLTTFLFPPEDLDPVDMRLEAELSFPIRRVFGKSETLNDDSDSPLEKPKPTLPLGFSWCIEVFPRRIMSSASSRLILDTVSDAENDRSSWIFFERSSCNFAICTFSSRSSNTDCNFFRVLEETFVPSKMTFFKIWLLWRKTFNNPIPMSSPKVRL